MNSYMKKFERNELIGRDKKVIKNRKQAIAIGISISDKKCESKHHTSGAFPSCMSVTKQNDQ